MATKPATPPAKAAPPKKPTATEIASRQPKHTMGHIQRGPMMRRARTA